MGLVRMLLAFAVVLGHCEISQLVGGKTAVRIFYIISGYLMSYIIVERVAYASLRRFYTNRFLRLFPLYWIMAASTLALFLLFPRAEEASAFFDTYRHAGPWGAMALMVSNFTLFGQDWIMFTGVDQGHLRLVSNFREAGLQMHKGLLVPQAWTLGVEISFYLIAPLLLPRRNWIYAMLAISVAIRIYLFSIGLGRVDPWTYRFFPTELALFLTGALSHQMLKPLYERWLGGRLPLAANVVTWAIAAYIVGFAALPFAGANSYLIVAVCAASIPLLFEFQRHNRWDKFLGEFSYPLYIIHMFALAAASLIPLGFLEPLVAQGYRKAVLTIVLTFAISYLAIRYFNPMFEAKRDQMRRVRLG